MYSLSDVAVLAASVIGIILPRCFVKTKLLMYLDIITVSGMFLVAIAGAWLIHLISGDDVSTLFIRLFIVIGISNTVYIFSQFEMMRRLQITKEAFEAALKGAREKEKSS